jgi:hypothetical protein
MAQKRSGTPFSKNAGQFTAKNRNMKMTTDIPPLNRMAAPEELRMNIKGFLPSAHTLTAIVARESWLRAS